MSQLHPSLNLFTTPRTFLTPPNRPHPRQLSRRRPSIYFFH